MNKQEAIKKIESNSLNIGNNDLVVGLDVARHIINQIDEPQKVVVPKFVGEWVDDSRECCFNFDEWFDCGNQPSKVYDWLNCENRRQSELNALALSTLIVHGRDAVIVEEEKKYMVILKGNSNFSDYLVDTVTNGFRFYNNIYTDKREHTRKELEEAGFGWVFDCEGIEIEEVEE